jgi:hypothetical protein
MGRDAHYYFDPPMDPINDLILPRQREWFHRLGKRQAEWFDRYGFAYTTREMFDAFYPGYGSTWPTMHGSIGILWEQAGVRGKVIARSDETQLHYHDAVRHHYISGLATIEAAVENRQQLLEEFYQARVDGVRLGREGAVRDYFLMEGRAPFRTALLAELLNRNGIDVRRVKTALRVQTTSVNDGVRQERVIPTGSYHIPLAQPASRLIRTILDRDTKMNEEFVKRQLDRLERRLPDEIYDITAWTLPLSYGVVTLATHDSVEVEGVPLDEWSGYDSAGERANLAYLIPAEDDGTNRALMQWIQAGLRVHVADQPLKLKGTSFSKGSLIVKVHENSANVHDAVAAAQRFRLMVHATETGLVDHGAHLGGPDVRWVKPPRIVLLVDRPASYTAGHTWYLFDQVWQFPVTRVGGRALGNLDLSKYNVLILPDGNYSDADAPNERAVTRIKEWVRSGGTLITLKGATAWAANEKVRLLATKVEKKPTRPGDTKGSSEAVDSTASASESAGAGIERREPEPLDPVPGAFLRADVYDDHWVTFGMSRTTDVLMNTNIVLTPLRPVDGRNLVTFASWDSVLRSGFCWPDTLKQIAGKPYVVYQSLGEGHVIGFADDPNFRAMCPEVQRLFLNAVLFGPGH